MLKITYSSRGRKFKYLSELPVEVLRDLLEVEMSLNGLTPVFYWIQRVWAAKNNRLLDRMGA